jgi:4-diphosphocytidyl-2-C-methyl-D-erythritol kinase
MIKLEAPAKINLTLEVLAKRPDGFHELCSVIQTISLSDIFIFQLDSEIAMRCDKKGWDPQQSLVNKTASLLKQETGYSGGAIIEITKKIPLSSGLGGDSSNAAAILVGLNRLWGLAISQGGLAELATQLGSDVPFFLFGGTALIQGRGEMVSPLPPLQKMWLVLLMPQLKSPDNKTAQLYKGLNVGHYTDGCITEEMVALLTKGGEIIPANLFNVFEKIAYDNFKRLNDYRRCFLQAGAESVHLAGSGPALFTILREKARAKKIYNKLKEQRLEVYLAETLEAIKATNTSP